MNSMFYEGTNIYDSIYKSTKNKEKKILQALAVTNSS